MARDPKITRKAYEYKLGKDLASKLDDKQIYLLSQYYNSLSDKETSDIDSQIVQGRNNTELHEMAIGMVEENESKKTPPKPKAKPKPKVTPKPKAKPKKVYDENRSVAYKLPDYILKDLDEDQIRDLSSYYNSLPPDQKRKVDSEMAKGSGDLMDLARQMSDPLQEKYNTGGLDTWTGKPKENSNAKQGPMPMPSAKKTPDNTKKPDKKAVTAIVKKFSAEKKEDTKQQTTNETVDPKILKILGLDDVFDLDYDEYRTLLKEKITADQMGQKVDSGNAELIRNEYKRVKRKTGRFKSKKKTVNISKVVQSGKKYNKSAVNAQKLLSGSKEAESTKAQVKGNAVADSFANIGLTLLGIDSLLKGLLGEEKKESEQDAKAARKSAQKAEEEKSEKSAKTKATKSLKGFKAPKMGFLDMIKRFFKNILLGGFIMKALDWFQNEENQKKIQNVITFITDNLDKILLGIAAIVGIGIGMKILGFLKLFSPLVSGLSFVLKGLLGLLMGPAGLIALIAAALAKGADDTRKRSNRVIEEENAKRKREGKPPMTTQEETDLLMSPGGIIQTLPGMPTESSEFVEGTGPKQDISKIPELETSYDDKDNSRVIDVPLNPVSKEDHKKYQALYQKAWSMTSIADGTNIRIEDVGTIKRGTIFGGIPSDKYFDKNGKKLLGPYAFWELYDKVVKEKIEKNKGKPSTFDISESQPETVPPVPSTAPPVTPKTSLLGKQSSAPTADYGAGSDGGPKGYVIVPGHAAGLGAPGEMELTPMLANNLIENLRKRVGPDVPVTVMNMHAETELTQAAFTKQQDRLKALEDQGYEVIEIHMDASVESGASPGGGRGVILPMPGTDAINPVEADFAKNYGAFPREHRGGLGGTNRGIALVELGNTSEGLAKGAKAGTVPKSDLDLLTKPLEDSFIRALGLMEVKPGHSRPEPPAAPNTDPGPTVIPVGGEGSGDTKLSSASSGRPPVTSFSSTNFDGNQQLTASIYNVMADVS